MHCDQPIYILARRLARLHRPLNTSPMLISLIQSNCPAYFWSLDSFADRMATGTAMTAAAICLPVLNTSTGLIFCASLPPRPSSLKFSSVMIPSLIRRQKRFSPLREYSGVQCTELHEKQEVEKNQAGEENLDGETEDWIRKEEESNQRKLFVVNLPWSYPASKLENLFAQCGSVNYVEMIKQPDGRNRGFAFVTMASPEEAQAAIEKLDSFELAGRIIRVQLSKSFSRPRKKQQPSTPNGETTHKIYVGNLHWKARAGNLREFFSSKFKPLSARVVFDDPSGKSSGYGFVSFDTKEEMEAAVSELDGVELMGRPLRLHVGQRTSVESQAIQDSGSEGW